MNEKEKLENAYRQLYRGMIGKNRDVLSEVLDSDFVLIHMTGMRQSKEAFIRSIEDGTLNYFSAEHQNIETEIHGDTAVLIGQSIVNAAVFGSGRSTWRLQLKIKLTKSGDSWLMNEAQASVY
ncbi:MAG: nuclear transport factor 2 family protein [Oscillospiraceae bacterium]|nr:nuclear transport factor 2 family protein [Oscillospiraceae bacterium]